jgi:hypothetical protein
MPPVSVNSDRIDTPPHDSLFLRSVRELVHHRPHLNAARGSGIYRRKKIAGERALPYEDLVAILRAARNEGAKRGEGPELICVLLNCLVRDTLPAGSLPDVIVKPADPEYIEPAARADEQVRLCVTSSTLVTKVEEFLSDGVLEVHEARQLHASVRQIDLHSRRLVNAAERDGAKAVSA